jgi:hypothetical protein
MRLWKPPENLASINEKEKIQSFKISQNLSRLLPIPIDFILARKVDDY